MKVGKATTRMNENVRGNLEFKTRYRLLSHNFDWKRSSLNLRTRTKLIPSDCDALQM